MERRHRPRRLPPRHEPPPRCQSRALRPPGPRRHPRHHPPRRRSRPPPPARRPGHRRLQRRARRRRPSRSRPGQIGDRDARRDGCACERSRDVDGGSRGTRRCCQGHRALRDPRGPKHGSGYHWYEVRRSRTELTGIVEWPRHAGGPASTGWVAVASRMVSVAARTARHVCPAKPTDVMALASPVPLGARRACFSRASITVRRSPRILAPATAIRGLRVRPASFRPARGS